MNFLRTASPFLALFVAIGTTCVAGCSDENKAQDSTPSPNQQSMTAVDSMSGVATSTKESASDTWARIRDYTFEKHVEFIAGYQKLIADTDAQIQRLKARRATLSEIDAKDWDFDMKDLTDARSDLDDKLGQLKAAASDTWDDAKAKSAAAWKRVVDDEDKVRHTAV